MSRANEQAFPTAEMRNGNGDVYQWASSGLTIREHFAGLAMQGIIASGRNSSSVVLDVAAEAREYADAMLDELAREPRS